jgi:lipoate-protein ligase A
MMPETIPHAAFPGPRAPVDPPGLSFDDQPTPGETLMARDASRLAAGSAAPSMLWFTWDRPTITLGHLQDAARTLDLARSAVAGIPVVRRPTGGRAVFHVDEWTYGAIVPLDHPTLGGSLQASCRAIVRVVVEALGAAYGIAFDRGDGRGNAPGFGLPEAACFSRSFGYEAVVDGRKLMGSAQRRAGGMLLQQGSLLVGRGHGNLARFLTGGGAARADENALERSGITLTELLGGRPDPRPFRAALARAWTKRVETSARSA